MKRCLVLCVVAFAVGCEGPKGGAEDERAAKPLREAVATSMEGLNAQDIDKVMSVLHPDSPSYEMSRRMTLLGFRANATYALTHFRRIGGDGVYEVARVTQETKTPEGSPAPGGALDSLMVFRRDGEDWKIWQTVFLAPEAGPVGDNSSVAELDRDKAGLSATLREVLNANYRALNAKDADGCIATIHPNSPGYQGVRKRIGEQLKDGATSKLLGFRYIGTDGVYVVAGAEVEVAAGGAKPYRHTVDSITAFRRDGDTWKVWTALPLVEIGAKE
jgi:hypothetical protein